MKKLFKILPFFLFLGFGANLIASSYTSQHPYKTIEEQSINGVNTKLKIKANPSLNVKNWISLEFENKTKESLIIDNASYAIDCKIYNKKGGKLINEGRIAVRSASELLDKSLDSPIPMNNLEPGNNISAAYPSLIGSILLSVPKENKVYVEATLQLNIQLIGQDKFNFNWEEIPFSFEWSRPEPIVFSDLYQHLNQLLDNPEYTTLHHFELLSLLSVPEVSKGVNVKTLIKGLKKRNGKEDGRIAILYYLNDHHSDEKVVLNYYLELLKAKDRTALSELNIAPDLWDDRFLEPLIEQYQNSNINSMHEVMNVLYTHQNKWIKKEGISAILSDLILYKYETIIYEDPSLLSKKELLTVSLLLDMLGKTGNKEIIPVVCPFVDEKERILDSGLVLDPNSLELPRPMRVCDNALEALMRLDNMNFIKTYKKKKYKPPYENGEAEIIISRIRDTLIKDFKKKGKTCR